MFSTKTHKIARFAYVFKSGGHNIFDGVKSSRGVVRIKWHRSVAYEIRAVHLAE